MTLDELDAMVEGKKVIRHHGQVFVNAFSQEEADRFAKAGANVQPYVIRGKKGWEVFLSPMLDPMEEEDEDGNILDLRGQAILEHFRERGGFAVPELHRGVGNA